MLSRMYSEFAESRVFECKEEQCTAEEHPVVSEAEEFDWLGLEE